MSKSVYSLLLSVVEVSCLLAVSLHSSVVITRVFAILSNALVSISSSHILALKYYLCQSFLVLFQCCVALISMLVILVNYVKVFLFFF